MALSKELSYSLIQYGSLQDFLVRLIPRPQTRRSTAFFYNVIFLNFGGEG